MQTPPVEREPQGLFGIGLTLIALQAGMLHALIVVGAALWPYY